MIVMYQNCAGERMADYINSVGASYSSDIPKQELLEFHYRVLDCGKEVDLKGLPVNWLFRRLRLSGDKEALTSITAILAMGLRGCFQIDANRR
jgi:hypothetical protein